MIPRAAIGAALMLAALSYPATWLEVERSGTATLVGQFVGSGGSARPIAP
jgi:hypothetical protein